MKQEAMDMKQELGHIRASHAEMAFAKVMAEEALKESARECDDLKEKVLRLEEEKRILFDREARGEARYKKLVQDWKNEKEVHRVKVCEFERDRRNAEALIELYKQRDVKMGARVSQLEDDVHILLSHHSRGGVVQINDSDDEEKGDNTFTSGLNRTKLEDSHGDISSTVPRF